jgi:hypothetical protein
MNKYTILIVLLLIGVILSLVLSEDTHDVGKFKVIYSEGAKKHRDVITRGVNKWSKVLLEPINLRFTTSELTDGKTIASTLHRTVTIFNPVFNDLDTRLQVIAIAHEIGHALGIGTWKEDNVSYLGTQPYLTGFPDTQKEYSNMSNSLPGPALANQNFGEGSALSHWSPNPSYGLDKDIMVPSISTRSTLISKLDLVFINELGVKVNIEEQTVSIKDMLINSIYGNTETDYECGSCKDNHDH